MVRRAESTFAEAMRRGSGDADAVLRFEVEPATMIPVDAANDSENWQRFECLFELFRLIRQSNIFC